MAVDDLANAARDFVHGGLGRHRHMAAVGKLTNPDGQPMTRKQLQHALEARGVEISMQGIGCWLRGETSPRPHHQAALASIFAVPARRLFPIEAA